MTTTKAIDMQAAELEKIHAEIGKLIAESSRLNAEAGKLNAETRKLSRETLWYPVAVSAAMIGAVVTITKLFL